MKAIVAAAVLVMLAGAASAQTLEDLKNDGKNPDNVLTYGMGYSLNRYSPLKQIDKTTVKRLVPIWNLSLDNPWGEQAQPLVFDGVMYVTNARATVAIDVGTGKQIWKTPVDWLPETPRVVCCGVSNKGAAILNGKLYRTTLDAHVIALDAKTGKEIWNEKAAEWKEGYSNGCSADRQQRADHRHLRRGVRHSRFHRRLGPGNRQTPVAPLHDSGARRTRQRDLAAGHRCLEDRWRLELGHRLLRSRP